MIRVSWDDVQEFIHKLNEVLKLKDDRFSLPSEAQWEYAAKPADGREGAAPKWRAGEAGADREPRGAAGR
jgi:formylglycine-generating enzyme required for sulfatase activity